MQPGYQQGSESTWWWMVAKHLDDAQQALANAMAHNVDDPRPVQALYGRLREGQAILLDIFRMKGLLPAAPPPGPGPGMPMAGGPSGPMPGPGMPWPGMPGPGMPGPPPGNVVAGEPPVEQGSALAHDEPAVPAADHEAVASDPVPAASNGVHAEASPSEAEPSESIPSEPSEPSAAAPDPSVEGASG